MSLHVDLSPEAQAALARQKRNSTISAVVIAILTLVLVGLILAFIAMKITEKKQEKVIAYAAGTETSSQPTTDRKVNDAPKAKPSAPSASMAKALASSAPSPVAVPMPDFSVPEPSASFGAVDDDFGEAWGSAEDSGGGGFAGIPATMQNRCTPEARMQRLTQNGGTASCEEAVLKALRWMMSKQKPDGSWDEGGKSVGMTGLAILAYLGHCETPVSEEFGDSCLRAITYLVNKGQKTGGALATSTADKHWPYEHSIAAYALAEAYTFCNQLGVKIPNLKEVVQNAGDLIIDSQHSRSGGWDYSYSQDSGRGGDLSLTGWHIQALKACKHTGLDFKGIGRAMRGASKYVKDRSNDKGAFVYSAGQDHGHLGYYTTTGVGVLSMQMLGRASSRETRDGINYMIENTKFDYNTKFADLYAHYYEGQAAMNRGGKTWERYNAIFRDQLLKNQNADGSWKKPGGGQKLRAVAPEFEENVHYRTALCTLMLEVYYRFLPGTGEKTSGR